MECTSNWNSFQETAEIRKNKLWSITIFYAMRNDYCWCCCGIAQLWHIISTHWRRKNKTTVWILIPVVPFSIQLLGKKLHVAKPSPFNESWKHSLRVCIMQLINAQVFELWVKRAGVLPSPAVCITAHCVSEWHVASFRGDFSYHKSDKTCPTIY